MERPQAEPVVERPLHATEDSHNRGSEEGPAPSKRIQLPLTKHRLLINNWIRDSPITGVRTDRQSHLGVPRWRRFVIGFGYRHNRYAAVSVCTSGSEFAMRPGVASIWYE